MTAQSQSAFEKVTSGSPVGRDAVNVFAEVYDSLGLAHDRARILNENLRFRERLRELILDCRAHGGEARAEEGRELGYYSGYRPKKLADQVRRLRELFPELAESGISKPKSRLPDGAEGWFAIPRWQLLAPTYYAAVSRIALMLNAEDCHHLWETLQSMRKMRQNERTADALALLYESQQSTILAVPAQFGLRHRGRSVLCAREMFEFNEFGLGAFEVGIMLLTHPLRLATSRKDLGIHCPGDERCKSWNDEFGLSSGFLMNDGLLFGAWPVNDAHYAYGSASGFIP